jgi:hypothetical protein
MTEFNYSYKDHEFSVSDAVSLLDDWKVVKAQVSSYEKQEVIVKAFESQFPDLKLLGSDSYEKFEFLTKLCSRNASLIEWFAGQKLIYSELAQLPNYLKDVVDPSEFQLLKEKIFDVNKVIAEYSDKRLRASENYNKQMKLIETDLNKAVDAIKANNKVLKVLTLTSQSLPVSMAIALESYNAKTDSSDFEEKKKLYVRELLTEFKISLLKLISKDPEIDIDALIKDISLK